MLFPVIMAGGSGSRLWPLSRESYPKQFLKVVDDESMLQKTLRRLRGVNCQPPVVICNEEHRFIAAEQIRLGSFKHSGIILEPMARNTAPAITLAALHVLTQNKDEDPTLLVLAADHLIENVTAFQKAVSQALSYSLTDQLVTFGIIPTAPVTGYGYIKRGRKLDEELFHVDSFVEKPDLTTAKNYLDSGQYYWNSGIFMFKAKQFLTELKTYNPTMLAACKKAMSNTKIDLEFVRIDRAAFERCPSDSIDYAIMEPKCSNNSSNNLVVLPMDAGWNDLGSWSAIWDVSDKDLRNNVHKGDVVSVNSNNNYIHAENKLIATVGIKNLIVVETKDAVLVADKAQVQEVKSVVQQLKNSGRNEYKIHRTVYRPWGKLDTIDLGERDLVRRITVNPGKNLSIQKHRHRSEHWIVVFGTASVVRGAEEITLSEGQSVYIPVGVIHTLKNLKEVPLEMIEVQTGSYLSEHDIVRFE